MRDFLLIINILLACFTVVLILSQGKGAGLGSAWGGSGEVFQTRRGVEKLTMRVTVICIILFLLISVLSLFLG